MAVSYMVNGKLVSFLEVYNMMPCNYQSEFIF